MINESTTNSLQKPFDALAEYSRALRALFGDDLVGVYLTGSLALGAWHEGKSDVDCTVMLQRHPSDQQADGIRNLHRRLYRQYHRVRIETHYITYGELGRRPQDIEPVVSFHDNRLSRSKFNVNEVTWATLKWHGLTVYGLDVSLLPLDVGVDSLCAYVFDNVDSYWKVWLRRANRLYRPLGLYYLTSQAVEWGVTGISRMLYTIMEHDIASKEGATEYMLGRAPEQYQRVLREALCIRTNSGEKQFASPFKRRSEALQYMQYAIDLIESLKAG
jgi:hypothetical protein